VKLQVGDLVQHVDHPDIMGTVIMVATTNKGSDVCKVVINYNKNFPENIGKTRYLNQCYWRKLELPSN